MAVALQRCFLRPRCIQIDLLERRKRRLRSRHFQRWKSVIRISITVVVESVEMSSLGAPGTALQTEVSPCNRIQKCRIVHILPCLQNTSFPRGNLHPCVHRSHCRCHRSVQRALVMGLRYETVPSLAQATCPFVHSWLIHITGAAHRESLLTVHRNHCQCRRIVPHHQWLLPRRK